MLIYHPYKFYTALLKCVKKLRILKLYSFAGQRLEGGAVGVSVEGAVAYGFGYVAT